MKYPEKLLSGIQDANLVDIQSSRTQWGEGGGERRGGGVSECEKCKLRGSWYTPLSDTHIFVLV